MVHAPIRKLGGQSVLIRICNPMESKASIINKYSVVLQFYLVKSRPYEIFRIFKAPYNFSLYFWVQSPSFVILKTPLNKFIINLFVVGSTQRAFTCSKSTLQTPEWYVNYVQNWQHRHHNIFVDFEQTPHIVLGFLLLILNKLIFHAFLFSIEIIHPR